MSESVLPDSTDGAQGNKSLEQLPLSKGISYQPHFSNEEYENTLERFASFLGTHSFVNGAVGENSYQLTNFFYKDPCNPLGGGVCILPSFDLYSGDVPDVPMPKLNGNTLSSVNATNLMPPPGQKINIPPMAASVFGLYSQKKEDLGHVSKSITAASDEVGNADAKAAMLEKVAARNLGSKMTWTHSSAHLAPNAMLRSLWTSFTHLIDSRVRACTLLLLKHSLTSGDESSRANLLQILATSSAINLTAVVTKFQTLKLPPELLAQAALEQQETNKEKKEDGDLNTIEIVCPLLYEAVMDVTIQGQEETFKLRAAGTMKGKLTKDSSLIKYVEVELDTTSLVASMVEQARKVVFKAVSGLKSVPKTPAPSYPQQPTNPALPSNQVSSYALSDHSSLLRNKRSFAQSTSPQKDDENKPSLSKKSRSVTWNHPIDTKKTYENPMKKLKNYASGPALKSSKSFGKPDSSLFQSQKNATFAEFGRAHGHNIVPRFVNGRLSKDNSRTIGNFSNFNALNDQFSGQQRNAEFSAASVSLSSNMRMKNPGRDLMNTIGLFNTKRSSMKSTSRISMKSLSASLAASSGGSDTSPGSKIPNTLERILAQKRP